MFSSVDVENCSCLCSHLLSSSEFIIHWEMRWKQTQRTKLFIYVVLKKLLEWEENTFFVQPLAGALLSFGSEF